MQCWVVRLGEHSEVAHMEGSRKWTKRSYWCYPGGSWSKENKMTDTEQQRLGRRAGAQDFGSKRDCPVLPVTFCFWFLNSFLVCQAEDIIFDLDFPANLRGQWVLLTFLWPHLCTSLGSLPAPAEEYLIIFLQIAYFRVSCSKITTTFWFCFRAELRATLILPISPNIFHYILNDPGYSSYSPFPDTPVPQPP